MHGIVSLLDQAHNDAVEWLWQELADRCGVRGVYVTPFPHFSYHVAATYDVKQATAIVERVARDMAPFEVRTTGVGLFTGAHPVVYLPIVRTSHVSHLHHALWLGLEVASGDVVEHYHPDLWMPHITIGFGDIDADSVAAIARLLCGRALDWSISIDNLSLIYNTGGQQNIHSRYPLSQTGQALLPRD